MDREEFMERARLHMAAALARTGTNMHEQMSKFLDLIEEDLGDFNGQT